jgi:AsmA protein
MASVAAQPFSLDLMRTDRLLGLGGFTIDFSGGIASQAALMQSLDGRGSFDLADGAIKGFNIAKLASAIGALYSGGITNPAAVTQALTAARRPDEQTDFSKLLSEFSIDNGVVTSPTITLEGPYLTMTGAGVVDLANQTLDLRLLPRGSTAADNKSGRMIAVPLRVGGTFSKPTTGVDVQSLVQGKAEETLRNFFDGTVKRRRSGSAPATGNGEGEAAAPAPSPAPSPERQLLDAIIKPDEAAPADGAAPQTVRDPVGGALKSLFGRKREEAPKEPAEEDAGGVEN